MPDVRQLRKTLDELRLQLDQLDSVDPEVHSLLETAIAEIHQKIDKRTAAEASRSKDDADEDSIAQRLSHAAQHFEESHPTLSGTLGSIIDALSRMGI